MHWKYTARAVTMAALLLESISVGAAEVDKDTADVIKGTANVTITLAEEPGVEDLDKADRARITVKAAIRISTLLGEPVVACSAAWELVKIRVDGETYEVRDTIFYDLPPEVINQVDLVDATGVFQLGLGNQDGIAGYDEVFIPCDLGAMGPPSLEVVSYNVAGSPNWGNFMVSPNQKDLPEKGTLALSVFDDDYLSEEKAQRVYATVRSALLDARDQDLLLMANLAGLGIDHRLYLADVRINLDSVREYLKDHYGGHVGRLTYEAARRLGLAESGKSYMDEAIEATVETTIAEGTSEDEPAAQRLKKRFASKAPHGLESGLYAATGAMMDAVGADAIRRSSALVVRSNVGGDTFHIDGHEYGATGPGAIRLRPGKHSVRVSKPGYEDWSAVITVGEGEREIVHAELERKQESHRRSPANDYNGWTRTHCKAIGEFKYGAVNGATQYLHTEVVDVTMNIRKARTDGVWLKNTLMDFFPREAIDTDKRRETRQGHHAKIRMYCDCTSTGTDWASYLKNDEPVFERIYQSNVYYTGICMPSQVFRETESRFNRALPEGSELVPGWQRAIDRSR